MAANEITFKVKVEKDGNLKVIAKDSEAAAKGTEKLGTETDKLSKKRTGYQKVEKGVGQAGLSTAKGFSKQAGAITGGLVPAYAVLAANIFAITAAFNALKEAAQVKALEEGFATLGNTVGRTSSLMAQELINITDGAIAMDQALRSSAAGFSAGFSMEEMKGLAEIARGASIALGRDLGDALDRLVRGTAKLEPEILDELGIFIRLDDAVDKYAQTLGKAGGQLTNAERRQAFLNEALLQGERKFAAVTDVSTNPFDKLAAAATNLAKSFLRVINVAVVPFINLLSNNMIAFVGVLTLFANSVASQMLPALYGMGAAQRENANEAKDAAESAVKSQVEKVKAHEKAIRTTKTAMGEETKFAKLQKRMGTKKEKKGDREEMLKSLKRSAAIRTKNIEDTSKKSTAAYIKERDEIQDLIDKMEELNAAKRGEGDLGADLSIREGLADAENNLAGAMEKVNKAGAFGGFKEAWKGTKQYTKEVHEANSKNKKASGIMGFLGKKLPWVSKGFTFAATGARLFGIALINAIPIIGQILFVGGLLIQWFASFLGKATDTSKQIDVMNTVVDGMDEKFEQLGTTLDKSHGRQARLNNAWDDSVEAGYRLGQEITVLSGIVNESAEAFGSLAHAVVEGQVTAADKVKYRWGQAMDAIKAGWNGIKGVAASVGDALSNLIPDIGFWDAVLGSDEEVASDILTSGFVEPLEELMSHTDASKQKQVKDLFEAFNLDPKAPNAIQDLADKIKAEAQANVDSGKAKNLNAEYARLLNKQYGVLVKTTDQLVKQTTGAAEVFNESSESLRSFFSKEEGKDTFLTMANDAGKLRDALGEVAKNSEESKKAMLDKIKDSEGSWLRGFFGSEEDFKAAGFEEIEGILKEVEERSTTISDAQKNAALWTKKYASELGKAKAQLKQMQQAFKFNDIVAAINPLKKDLRSIEVQQKRINALRKAELEIQKKIHDDKVRQMKKEMDFQINEVKLLMLNLDKEGDRYKLLDQQLTLLTDIKKLRGDTLDIENDIANAQIKQKAFQKQISKSEKAVAGTGSGSLGDRLLSMSQFTSKKGAMTENKDVLMDAFREEIRVESDAAGIPAASDYVDAEALKRFDSQIIVAGLEDMGSSFQMFNNILNSMLESLKQLGPDGEVVISLQAGMFQITQGAIGMATLMAAGADKAVITSAALSQVSATIGATAQIMTAASDARVAGIDREIDAEKKRDGKSKESLAKIKQLEAKKDAMKRKQFEMNKKMLMAQTVMNTAAAYVGIMAAEAELGLLAPVLATIALVMGAAQLAIIAGTSYQGGASGINESSGPSKISVGKRKSSVDVSKSQGAAGELAYFRGESGRGGPENFRGAFYGARHRAAGGNAGYIVGEQGPELFMPDRPGTIVPADDTAEALGGGGNVTFNISTIDATGVEEVLEEQQGNIIGMLRQAANSYGREFFEEVDESIYSSPQARRA